MKILTLIVIALSLLMLACANQAPQMEDNQVTPPPSGPAKIVLDNSDDGMAETDAATDIMEVQLENKAFIPSEVTIPVGASIVWINNDDSNGAKIVGIVGEAQSPSLNPGDKWQWEFSEPGEYQVRELTRKYRMTVFVE